jgi:hypothetical protein
MREDLAAWNWQMAWQRAYDAALDFQAQLRDREAKLAEKDATIEDIQAAFDDYRRRWNADQLPYKEMHDAAVTRAKEAEATLARVRELHKETWAMVRGYQPTDSEANRAYAGGVAFLLDKLARALATPTELRAIVGGDVSTANTREE